MMGERIKNVIKFKEIKKFLQWESFNWGRGINFWFHILRKNSTNWGKAKVLEIGGGRHGELSLIFGYLGVEEIICSDINKENLQNVEKLHKNYIGALKTQIKYEMIDTLKIPYKGYFTVIAFKSVLGGVSRNGRNDLKYQMIDEVYKALAPGGYLLFVENLEGTFIHRKLRRKFTTWGTSWNYLKLAELPGLMKNFRKLEFKTFGFLGNLAPYKYRNFLGYSDWIIEKIIPSKWNYLISVAAKK